MSKKSLVIVESPAKARTINRYLGRDFTVLASVGHVRDLPEKELGINIEKDFSPRYVTVKGKQKIIRKIRDESMDSDKIFIATDPDREGEAIGWHIASLVDRDFQKTHRVLFNEITKESVNRGIANPIQINRKLVDAQVARRILDRLVGYQVSPLLWKILYSGLSAGRVQSVALKLICDREEKVENFVPEEYWTIQVNLLSPEKELLTAKLIKIDGEKSSIPDEKTAETIAAALQKSSYTVHSTAEKIQSKSPYPPYITSTLQQDAASRIGFSPKKTMSIAQQLYEGIEINGDSIGLITYMRTDSFRVANEAYAQIRAHIQTVYGEKYLHPKTRYFRKSKSKVQDAHEAIRPTSFNHPPDSLRQHLSPDQMKLYTLIWNRFVASQMKPAKVKQRTIDIMANGRYLFRATGSEEVFPGYRIVYRPGNGNQQAEPPLPSKIKKGDNCTLESVTPGQHFTQPPPRFSESSLIKELDSEGIGRPSTYASIVSTLFQRQYIQKEKSALVPTEVGRIVNHILVSGMPDIFNVKFTAQMENDLDKVESGEVDYLSVLQEFYGSFRNSLDHLHSHSKEIKESLQESTGEKCEKCGSPMVIKWSRKGRFLACSGFPKCRNARPLVSENTLTDEERQCKKCDSEMTLKEGRFGKFWACTNFPECRYTEPYTIGIRCPENTCDGLITEKRNKRGRYFYSCNKYPECRFMSWYRPVDRKCTQCDYPVLSVKTTKSKGDIVFCTGCKTEYPDVQAD